MAEAENTEKLVDEAMNGFREVLRVMREDHAKRVGPLYENLHRVGSPVGENEREYVQSIRRQIAQLDLSQQEIERPIVAKMVEIESMRLRPLIISRAALPEEPDHG